MESLEVPWHQLAAQTIASSNFLLAISGEEMSVDSGLPTLEMLASNPLYQDIGLDAAVLTSTKCLTSERDCDLLGLFYGFWGNWYNTVKGSFPHGGYKELEAWKRMFFNASPANPVSWSEQEVFNCRPLTPWFFFFTTNIDSHPQNYFHDNEGSIEYWQCSVPCPNLPQRWKLPINFNFIVDYETMMAPSIPGRGRFAQLYHNRPVCLHCGGPARPAVVMADDQAVVVDDASFKRYEFWKYNVVQTLASDVSLKMCILELGCNARSAELDFFVNSIENKDQICIIQVNPQATTSPERFPGVLEIPLFGRPRDMISELDKILRPNIVNKVVKFVLPETADRGSDNVEPGMASYPYPKLMGSPKREVALDPLNELLAYIAPRETVQELIARSVSFNKALFDRIMEIDSFLIGEGIIVQGLNTDELQRLVDEISTEVQQHKKQQHLRQQELQRQKRQQKRKRAADEKESQGESARAEKRSEDARLRRGFPGFHATTSAAPVNPPELEGLTTTTTTVEPADTTTTTSSIILPPRRPKKREREKLSLILPFVESFCSSDRCQWLYRFSLDFGSEIFGPFLTNHMLSWLGEGWFSAVEVWVKPVDCVVYLQMITERQLKLAEEEKGGSQTEESDFGDCPWISSSDIDLAILFTALGTNLSNSDIDQSQQRKRSRKKRFIEDAPEYRLDTDHPPELGVDRSPDQQNSGSSRESDEDRSCSKRHRHCQEESTKDGRKRVRKDKATRKRERERINSGDDNHDTFGL